MKRTLLLAVLAAGIMGGSLWGQVITVTAPAAGDDWCIGSTHSITWTSSGVTGPLSIKLRPEAGTVLNIKSSTDDDGSFSWTIDDAIPPGVYTVRVRTVAEDPLVSGDSARFTVSDCAPAGSISVSSPMETGAYMVRGATPMPIAWTSSGITGSVRIELENCDTGGLFPIAASHPCDGSPLSYPIPDGVAAGTYRVKISQGSVVGRSGRIHILAYVAPSLSLVSPNGGEILYQGRTHTIEWDAHNLDGNVRIELLRGGVVYQVLAESHFVNTGFFTWRNILSSSGGVKYLMGGDFKISIRTLDRRFRDVSDASFTIQAPPGVWLVKPAAGEVWEEDSTREIRWNAQGLEGRTVVIILRFTSGSPLNIRTIATGVPAMDKRYSWKVMDLVSGPYNLRAGSYPDAVISIVTEGSGWHCSSVSKEFTILKR